MNRTAPLVLASVTAFFLVFPLTVGKPGMPAHLKADEAAYYLMALSLARDGDLQVQVEDVDRVFEEFPFQPVNNMIVMTDDGWNTVYYGKPYIYSLFAAPFAVLFGANGLVFFNMALMMGMVWMGYLYLRRWNPDGVAALFSAGFFLLSVGFVYVFWLQPEVFSMAAIAACLFFGLPRPDETGRDSLPRPLLSAALSGAAIVLAAYNKPMFAAVGLAPLFVYARGRQWKTIGAWMAGALLAAGITAGVATALTGHPSSYLGVRRQGVTICEPGKMPISPEVTEKTAGVAAGHSPTGNAFSWLIRVPEGTPSEVLENIGYFLWGRHAGLLLYTPFAGLAVLLFLLHGRRAAERWVLAGLVAGIALWFLLFIAWNWQGGGGFVGNRYFISVYPAFLFLVTRIRPPWMTGVGYGLAGLFLAPILFTPFGAGGPEPTLQSHVRNAPFRFFPLELSLRNVPGYERVPFGDLRIVGRKDVFLPRGDTLWLRGASRVELHLLASRPIGRASFLVDNDAPGNRIEVRMGDAREALELGPKEARRIDLVPGGPDKVRTQWGNTFYVYRLIVTPRTGRIRHWTREYPPNSCPYFTQDADTQENFFLGAAFTYLGAGEHLDADVYAVQWGNSVIPSQVRAGEKFTGTTRLFNRSRQAWTAEGGVARVNLSYHWLDAAGREVVKEGDRTTLELPVPPGGRVSVQQNFTAPAAPGRYVLELDPVFEHVSWFSLKNGGKTYRVPVEVLP